jgi:membrane-associated phospholipid phosphatase
MRNRRALAVLAFLGLALGAGPLLPERVGDRLQAALPLAAWGCEALSGRAGEYLVRYVVMFVAAHGSKQALGEAEVNQRPTGGLEGMPSAHTSTAVLGASSLAHGCLRGSLPGQAAAVLGAGFVGASRIEADQHDIWQVLAGALLGLGCDRALRRPSPLRRRAGAALAAAAAALAEAGPRLATGLRGAVGPVWRIARGAAQGARARTSSATLLPDPRFIPSMWPMRRAASPVRAASAAKAAASRVSTKASAQGAAAIARAAAAPGRSRTERSVSNTTEGSP